MFLSFFSDKKVLSLMELWLLMELCLTVPCTEVTSTAHTHTEKENKLVDMLRCLSAVEEMLVMLSTRKCLGGKWELQIELCFGWGTCFNVSNFQNFPEFHFSISLCSFGL